MPDSLDLIVLRVADIDASATFYRALGLVLIEEQHERGPRHFSMDVAGVTVELYPRGERASTSGQRLELLVADPAACLTAALAHGGKRVGAAGFSVEDLDGHRLSLRAPTSA